MEKQMPREQFNKAAAAMTREATAAVQTVVSDFLASKVAAGELDTDTAERCRVELRQLVDDALQRCNEHATAASATLFAKAGGE